MSRCLTLLGLLFLAGMATGQAPASHLEVHFGPRGLETLAWNGQLLEDTKRWTADVLHVWHMQSFDDHGKPLTTGEYGWGENNKGRTWDAESRTWTYLYEWGSIRVAYEQHGDTLDLHVTATNRAGSGVVFDGASIFPLTLHLPPSSDNSTQISDGVDAPGITQLGWGENQLAIVVPDESRPLYSGYQAGSDHTAQIILSGTRPDALPHLQGAIGRSLKPGETDSFVVSLRFAAAAVPLQKIAADAFKSFAQSWPQTLHWTDRRPIGTVFLASSAQGDKTHGAGFPANPRRYFTDAALDIRSDLPAFQARVLEQAQTVVADLKRMGAQGAITWDIEGEEYPQDTSYVCSPDQIAQLAPEMETVVSGNQKFAGMKLDDAYFKIIRDAGFRVGVCVRPQHFTRNADSTARQQSLPDDQVAAELTRKMRFAHDRWGATIFYLDSTVRADGTTLPAAVIERAAASMPDSLLIPEESSPRMYRATAPFRTFLFHGDLGTPDAVRACYPQAFSANMINDVDAHKLELNRAALTDAVRHGDILMGLAGFWQANDDTIVDFYRNARKR
jgi:hypothetical protein